MLGSFLKSNADAFITVGIVGACAFGLVKYAGRIANRVPRLEYVIVEDPNQLGYTLVAVDGHDISTAELVALDRAIDVAHDALVQTTISERLSFEEEIDAFIDGGGFKRTPEDGWFE